MNKAVLYESTYLMPNSEAYGLWQEVNKATGPAKRQAEQKLKQHMKDVFLRHTERLTRYDKYETRLKQDC